MLDVVEARLESLAETWIASPSFDETVAQISAYLGGGKTVLPIPVGLIDEDPTNPRLADGNLRHVAAADIKIVRVRPE